MQKYEAPIYYDKKRVKGEGDVTSALEFYIHVTRSDAQGIIEAQGGLMEYCYKQNYDALKTAQMVDLASRV